MRRGLFGLVCLCVLGLAAFLGSNAPSASAQACPNEALRIGFSASLPDCRAYEMVSPPDKEGQQVEIAGATAANFAPLAAADGEAASYQTPDPFNEGKPSAGTIANNFLARRGGGSWSSEQLDPPQGNPSPFEIISYQLAQAFTPSLDQFIIQGAEESPLYPAGEEDTRHLFYRDNLTATFHIASPGLPEGLEGTVPTTFQGVAADGSHVVFSTSIKLTGEGGAGPYLYGWSAATEALTLLAEGAVAARFGASNAWHIVSEDGSRVFIKSGSCGTGACVLVNGSLQELGVAGVTFWLANTSGSVAYFTEGGDLWRYDVDTEGEVNLTGGVAGPVLGVLGASDDGSRVYFAVSEAGKNSLYEWSEAGGTEFIVNGIAGSNWTTPSSRVSANGMQVAFTSTESLTGYPNAGHTEIYTYNAGSGELSCASCNPSGEPATTNTAIPGPNMAQLPRNVTNDGQVFFSSIEALVPGDVNGVQDAYEYDSVSGETSLLSSGTSPAKSTFLDASVSGQDVLIGTQQQLVGVDQDELEDVYDARVGGGLASQNPPPEQAPCTGEACHSESSSPNLAGAASAGFVGKGNISAKQNCNKLGKEAKKLSKRAKRLRKNAKKVKKASNASRAKKLDKKSNRLAKQARNKSKSAKKCRKRNRRASK
jgi:hypothetical protein